MKVCTLLRIAIVYTVLIHDCKSYTDLASTLLAIPKWMSKELNLFPSQSPPEKRLIMKLHGPGFYIRKVPTNNRHVARPSKYSVKYAPAPSNAYNILRPYTRVPVPDNPYRYEQAHQKPQQIEYVFEKPVYPVIYAQQQQFISPQYEHNSPIQTIPAPNLGPEQQQALPIYENQPHFHEPIVALPQQAAAPQHHHQSYQVTEDTNDITLVDPFTGKQKLFAPDPDPALPSKRLPIEVNPLSQPSNGKQQPLDVVNFNFIHSNDLNSNLQHHLRQQPSLLQDMPLTAYNPTYLVTQSNNLLKQYQQPAVPLFKPESNSYQQDYEEHAYNVHHVASPGQLFQAQRNQIHHSADFQNAQVNSHESEGHNILNIQPGSYQYILNDFSNSQPSVENQFEITHNAYDQRIQNERQGAEDHMKIYVPDSDQQHYANLNYAVQSRSDEDVNDHIYTNHKKAYTEITRIHQEAEDSIRPNAATAQV